jgi:hypothetical protein
MSREKHLKRERKAKRALRFLRKAKRMIESLAIR